MFSVWCQSKLLTAFCIELSGDVQFKPSIAGRILPNCETLRLSTRTVMELHDSQFLQMHNLYKTLRKLNLHYKIYFCLFVLPSNFQHSSTSTTNVSDNNKQYLLHFSAAVVITKCSGLLFQWKMYNALNCSCLVSREKLLVISVS